MKTITINIIKKSVMGVVEGLTATIAQHNPGGFSDDLG